MSSFASANSTAGSAHPTSRTCICARDSTRRLCRRPFAIAEQLLSHAAARATRRDRRHFLAGEISAGPRYETNANAGPDTALVLLNGETATLLPEGLEQDDLSLVLTGDIRHRYILDTQRGHSLETDLFGYVARYADVSTSNTVLASVDIGPRFVLGETGSTSIRPFVSGGYLGLDDDNYRFEGGGGINLRQLVRSDLVAEATLRAEYEDYQNTDEQPFASERSGVDLTLRPGLTWAALNNLFVSADVLLGRKGAEEGFEAYTDVGAGLSVTYVFDAGLVEGWNLTGNAFFRRSDYDDPEPSVDPGVAREDNRFDLGLTLGIPITERVGISAGARFTRNDSNLPNFEFDNTTVSVLATYAF